MPVVKIGAIENPGDIAHAVFSAADDELVEAFEINEKRTMRLKKPLPLPRWNVKEMIEHIEEATEELFKDKSFQKFAVENPWDGRCSKEAWIEMATIKLRDKYLRPLAHDDDDLNRQLCEIWEELIGDPALTDEQRAQLADLQKQADDIMHRAEGLATEFEKLAKQERDIIKNTQSERDEIIREQAICLKVNMILYKEGNLKKWKLF